METPPVIQAFNGFSLALKDQVGTTAPSLSFSPTAITFISNCSEIKTSYSEPSPPAAGNRTVFTVSFCAIKSKAKLASVSGNRRSTSADQSDPLFHRRRRAHGFNGIVHAPAMGKLENDRTAFLDGSGFPVEGVGHPKFFGHR